MLSDENIKLKEKIQEITIQVKQLSGAVPSSTIKSLVSTLSNLTYSSQDSTNTAKTKIIPLSGKNKYIYYSLVIFNLTLMKSICISLYILIITDKF